MGLAGRLLNAPGARELRLFYGLTRHGWPLRSSAPALYLQALRALRGGAPAPPTGERILLVTRSTVWLRISLALAAVLGGRGARVDLLMVPYGNDSLTEPALADDYYRLRALRRLLPGTDRLGLLFLSDLEPGQLDVATAALVHDQSVLDAKVILAVEGIDLEHDPAQRAVLEGRTALNEDLVRRVDPLLTDRVYDRVVVPNGAQWEHGAAYRLAGLRNVPRVALEYTELRGHAVITPEQTIEDMPTAPYWEADEPHVLTEERRLRVSRLVAERSSLDWSTLMQTLQFAPIAPADEVRAQVGLRPHSPVALLCSNLVSEAYYISSFVERSAVAFETMGDWVRETVRFFAERPEWDLVVRAHPWELKRTNESGVEELIRESFPELPPNLHIVRPADPVNTYSLMDVASLGTAFLSTTGLEMALRGIPVVTAGEPHYAGKGFTVDPTSPEEYLSALESFVADGPPGHLGEREVELAWCYMDVCIYGFPQPFPWVAHHFDQDIERWPIARCLSPGGDARFGASFDLFRGLGWSKEGGVPEGWSPSRVLAEPVAPAR